LNLAAHKNILRQKHLLKSFIFWPNLPSLFSYKSFVIFARYEKYYFGTKRGWKHLKKRCKVQNMF